MSDPAGPLITALTVFRARGRHQEQLAVAMDWLRAATPGDQPRAMFFVAVALEDLQQLKVAKDTYLAAADVAVKIYERSKLHASVFPDCILSAAHIQLREEQYQAAQHNLVVAAELVANHAGLWIELADACWTELRFISFKIWRKAKLEEQIVKAREAAFRLKPADFHNSWKLAWHYKIRHSEKKYFALLTVLRAKNLDIARQVEIQINQAITDKSHHTL